MRRAKKKSLLQALWELGQTLLFFGVLTVFMAGGFDLSNRSHQRQEGEQAEQPHLPRPQPKRILLEPKIFRPEPLPIIAEGAEPRHGKVVLADKSLPRRSSAYFQEQVAKMAGEAHLDYPMFWWNGPEKKVFIMTAMGRDNLHHVANAYLIGFQPFETKQIWVPLQTIATRLKYRHDEKQFGGMKDLWQTSKQAYYWLRGDCEDHALLLADWLIEMGYDARVAAGMHNKEGHAWVVVLDQGQTYLLEATSKRQRTVIPLAQSLPEYMPEFMFNRQSFWVNTGSVLTSNYSDAKWQKRSEFVAAY